MKKRLLSILLMCCMVLTLLPTAAFAEGNTEEPPVCICETACTAESMNATCSVCGAEDALPENCRKYAAPVNGEESVTGTSAQALTSVNITFPAPKAGDKVGDGSTVSADVDSGLTPYLFGPVLWQQDGSHQKLNADSVYAEGSVYWLQFTFYTQKPITAETAVTFNGQPVTLYTEYAAFEAAVSAYDGGSSTNLAFVMFSEDGTGDPSMEEVKNVYVVVLYAFVRIPKALATQNVSTAKELTDALADNTKDIIKLTQNIEITESLTVNRTVTLDLNNQVLNMTGNDSVIKVEGSGKLTLTDSADTKTEKKFTKDESGLWTLDATGEQSVTGGVITGGKAERGGGVYVALDGLFTMNGGNIAGCTARMGGGVYVAGDLMVAKVGTFTMNGGSIAGCTAKTQDDDTRGGGICNFGTLELSGDAEIRDCHAVSSGKKHEGGGIYSAGASLTIRADVKVTGCTADWISGAMYAGADRAQRTFQITGGTFDGPVYFMNRSNTPVTGGTFKAPVINEYGTINGGTFYGEVTNNDTITGGTFHGTVINKAGVGQHTQGKITGGVFYGQVTNEAFEEAGDGEPGEITGGVFYGQVTNKASTEVPGSKPGKITGGMFYGELVNDGTIGGCTVTYGYGELGGIYAQQIVQTGETAIRPTDPKMNGFTFLGWYKDETCTDESKYDFTAPVTGNITLYAKWQGVNYNLRIIDKNGTVYNVTSENADDVLGDGTVVYTPGYIEAGKNVADFTTEDWNKMLRGETVEGIRLPKLTLNGADLKQIAVGCWGDDSMTRQLNLFLQLELMGDNSIAYDETYPDEGAVESLNVRALCITGNGNLNVTAPAESGAGLSGDWSLYQQESGTVTITAGKQGIWYDTDGSFNLTFHGGRLTIEAGTDPEVSYSGVINSWGRSLSCDISKSATFLLGDSAENYISLTAPYTRDSVLQEMKDAYDKGTLTHTPFYLSLTANYAVTFDTDGGSAVDTQTIPYGEKAETPAVPARTGYTFAGWELDGKAYDFDAPVTEDLTLTAKWTTNQYTITYNLDGGTVEGNPDTYTAETESFTLKNPTRPGYTFTGWSGTGLTGENNMTVTIQKGSTGDRSYTAHWRYNGGSSGYSYYTIKATAGTGGSISPSGNVSVREGRDQTFTITPDKGYAVSNVKIDGKSIGAVKSYTFENVSRTHTIEVIFMKANGNPQTGVFVDVATGSYYEDAVDWAVENGITQGTDDTHFSPDGICTRAQAVTFLWRAAGSPKPETRTMPFTDVPMSSYYYNAVLWAVENGITKGTSDTTFSPNMTCSRAQIVTFLWRSEKSPAAGTANPFVDVKSTAYYADAVLWAVKEDITKGTTNTTFSPDADCTRAQIVTFLWRCKK